MAAKKNKDGFIPGQLVSHKEHNKWLIKKRQAENKARAKAQAEAVSPPDTTE